MAIRFLLIIGGLLCVCQGVSAAVYNGNCGANGNNVTYSLNTSTGVLSISGNGAMANWSAETDVPWRSYRSYIKTANIGNGVTSIANCSFYNCTNLTSVSIPNSVTSLGFNAFYGCTKLTSISIPSSVTTLGSHGFGSSNIADIYVYWMNTSGDYIPLWATEFVSTVRRSKVTLHVPCGTRSSYKGLTGWMDFIVVEPQYTITAKTNNSSYGTVKIDDGTAGANVSKTVNCATNVTLTAVTTTSNCNIDFLQWNDGNKDNPRTITAESSVTYTAQFGTIGGNCGANGNNLTWSLNRCTGVLTISGSGAMKDYERTGDNCAEYSSSAPWIAYKESITSIVLPVGLTRIGNYAFYQCRGVTDIDLPAALLSIGDYAFAETGLQQVCIPEGVTTIGGSAFAAMCSTTAGTTPLKRVYLPNSLTTIGAYALYYNPLKYLTYPASANSFSTPYRGAYPANEVYASWKTNVPSRQGRVEAIGSPKRKMHIPYGTTSLYQAKDWARIYQLVEDVDERAIDLGLSIRWASCNIGATAPEENGDFYAWGDTLTRSSFTWGTYPYSGNSTNTMTKYCTRAANGTVDNRSTLIAFDDAAYINWGETWRMPTWAEWNELITQCTWKDTTYNNVSVWQVTGPNGNSIYLPKVGYKNNTSVTAGCYYWSSTLNTTNSNDQCNRALYINAANRSSAMYGLRYVGMPVRAVYRREWPSFTLTITDTPEGTPYTKSVNAGSSYTLTAQEDDCHQFVQWSDGNTSNPRTVSVTADAVYTAEYETRHGICGATGNEANVNWTLSCDSILTISGTGAMADYTNTNNLPWVTHRDAIKTIIVEDGITAIGDRAFGYSTNATSVSLPSSVTSIGDYAFISCSSLQEITIPNTIDALGTHMLYACGSLTDIYVSWTSSIPECPTNFTNKSPQSSITLHVPCGTKSLYQAANGWKNYTIVDDVPNIKSGTYGPDNIEWSFNYCDSTLSITGNGELRCDNNNWGPNAGGINPAIVKRVFVGKGVTYLGIYTLSYMSNIEYIEVEDGHPTHRTGCNAIIRIGTEQEGDTLIFGCPHTVIPTTCTTIRGYAFWDDHLVTEMTIPSSVKQIANMQGSLWQGNNGQVFYTSNNAGEGLKDLYVEWTTLDDIPVVPNNRLGNMTNVRLHVPCGTTALYKQVTGWKNFKEYIEESASFTVTVQTATGDTSQGSVSITVP